MSSPAQRFKYDYDGRIVAADTNLCLTVKDNSTQPGAAVVMATCAATTKLHQVWRLDDNGSLRPKHMMWYPLCLNFNADSNAAVVTPCNASSDPTWTASSGQCTRGTRCCRHRRYSPRPATAFALRNQTEGCRARGAWQGSERSTLVVVHSLRLCAHLCLPRPRDFSHAARPAGCVPQATCAT